MAERLGMTVKQVLQNTTSAELSEWMAYELLKNKEFVDQMNKENELERFKKLNEEQQLAEWKKLFRGSND